MMSTNRRDVAKLPHHVPLELCTTRAKYRQGKKFTAVKVYTVNSESQHLLVCGVPSLGLQDDVHRLCTRFGDVKSLVFVPNYAEEEFTDVFHIQYSRIQSARYAKHHLDGRSFFGGVLHVCYVPEMESLAETRAKLIQRRKDVALRTRGDAQTLDVKNHNKSDFQPRQYHRQKKHPALPLTKDRLAQLKPSEANCIWQGVPQDIDPRTIVPAPELMKSTAVYGPQKPDEGWALAGVRERRIVTNFQYTKQTTSTHDKPSTSSTIPSSSTGTTKSSLPVLRFIPSQVTKLNRIIFRDTKNSEKPLEVDTSSSLKRNSSLEPNEASLEATIMEVRKKIRMVSVPNIQVILKGKDPLGTNS